MRKIILASSSERRADILKLAGISFDVHTSGYDENLHQDLPVKELVETFALGKALAIAPFHNDAIIIGADTVVVLDDEIMGKPGTEERAIKMLSKLSGNIHSVITGYAIIDTSSGEQVVGSEETKVFFRELSPDEIERYVREGNPSPLTLAGAYAIQAGAASFVTRIEGDFYTVVGLPLAKIVQLLRGINTAD